MAEPPLHALNIIIIINILFKVAYRMKPCDFLFKSGMRHTQLAIFYRLYWISLAKKKIIIIVVDFYVGFVEFIAGERKEMQSRQTLGEAEEHRACSGLGLHSAQCTPLKYSGGPM